MKTDNEGPDQTARVHCADSQTAFTICISHVDTFSLGAAQDV